MLLCVSVYGPRLLRKTGVFLMSAAAPPRCAEERAASTERRERCNQPKATLLWQRIERELLAQAPLVPADNPRNADFVSERVGNHQYNPELHVLLDQLWVR